jgi:hypothetical protein
MNRSQQSGSDVEALGLRAGEWVEVRSKEEILRTLDKKGQLDELPFMPAMFAYCGRRMQVRKSAHKTCDTINWTGGRRMTAAVHLDDAYCDGAGYDGCQARCLLFWKEAWLKRANGPEMATIRVGSASGSEPTAGVCTEADVVAAAKGGPVAEGTPGPTYVCQTTQLVAATTPLAWWDVSQYIEDYRSGNVGVRRMVDGFAYAAWANLIGVSKKARLGLLSRALVVAYDRIQALRGGVPWPRRRGTIPPGQKTPAESLNLQPGERVRVKPYRDILATLDENNKNRGLYFDAEHVPYCGGEYTVLSRVDKIIEEKTGKMMSFKTASIILDGAACQSRYSDRRMFCPRGVFPYFREIWLERVEAPRAS